MKIVRFKTLTSLSLCLLSVFAVSCAHYEDVRPGARGVHKVMLRTDNRDLGEREALVQAGYFCKERKRSIAILSESSKYKGEMSEKKYRNSKIDAKGAAAVGSTLFFHGSGLTSAAGAALGIGGAMANDSLGNAYTINMKFRCI